MEELNRRLNNVEYKNWLKVSIALLQSKEALHDFTKDVVGKIHVEIKKRTGSSRCDGTCKTNKGKQPSCSSCLKWVREIKSYNKGLLYWKNTEPTKWDNEPWEIAKCFMNAQGSKATALLNTGPEKTDLSGILNVLVNCAEFRNCYLKEKNLPEKVREIRNKVMHSAKMTFTDAEMKGYVQSVIDLLEDEKTLKDLEICKKKVRVIKLLRDEQFEIRPETEVSCIGDILNSQKQLLESGEEAELDGQSLAFLSNFIKSNKDLETKLQSKLASVIEDFENITDSLDKRITSIEVKDGKISGKIEWLETQITQLKKRHEATATASTSKDIHDKSLLKNSLQCYAQKKKLGLPEYSCERLDSGMFISTVCVADREFQSDQPKPNKKEAQQSAAEMALDFFRNEGLQNSTSIEKESSPSSNQKHRTEKNVSYKNLLQEFAQQQRVPLLPIYDTKATDVGTFVSSVLFDGAWFSPQPIPRAKKIEAEQDAAQFVLAYMEKKKGQQPAGNNFSDNSDKLAGNDITDSYDTCIPEHSLQRKASKTYKSILNEYCQKLSVDPSKYETTDAEAGKFFSVVTVNENVYKGMFPQKNKKDAEESVAMIACQELGLVHDMDNSRNTKLPITASSVTHVLETSVTPFTPVHENSPSTTTNKTYRSILNEHFQKLGKVDPSKYQTTNPEVGKFCSSIEVNGKVYEGESTMKSKKEAEESAAMTACQQLGLSCGVISLANTSYDLDVPVPTTNGLTGCLKNSVTSTMSENPTCADSTGEDFSDGPKTLAFAQEQCFLGTLSKTYKSQLHEYFQISGKAEPPNYDVITLETGKFVSNVEVNGEIYKSESPKNSKKEANESAAMVACLQLSLGHGRDCPPSKVDTIPALSVGQPVSGSCVPDIPVCEHFPPRTTNKTYRSILNEHFQKSGKLDPPKYQTTNPEAGKFLSSVAVNGKRYEGESTKSSKKESEENAAMVACQLLALVLDIDCSPSTTSDISASSTDQDVPDSTCTEFASPCKTTNKTYRSILNEHFQKSGEVDPPKYQTTNPEAGKFLSSVAVNGKRYEGESTKNSKKESEENAAMVACQLLALVLDIDCSPSTTSDISASSTDQDVPDSTCTEFASPCKTTNKTYRSILNEHFQKSGEVDPPKYQTTNPGAGKFLSSVAVNGKRYEGESTKSSKKESEENAAMVACQLLGLVHGKSCSASTKDDIVEFRESAATRQSPKEYGESTESVATRESATAEALTQGVQFLGVTNTSNIQSENVQEDGKVNECQSRQLKEKTSSSTAYKSNLFEHAKKGGINPRYVTAKVEGQGFQSRVFLGLRCFKGENATNKKTAEHNAAKAALEELRNCQSGSAEECKHILKEYHKKLIDLSSSDFPVYEEATSCEEDRFSVVITVVKRWTVGLSETRLGKKEVEKALAEKAISLLKECGNLFQNTENKSVTMQFHEFCQTQKGVPKFKYNVTGEQAGFSGGLCFYTLEQYESLCPQPSKRKAEASAAMSACNDLCLI